MIFREDQKPIMNYTGGSMAIPAVPGAGKTFIIANLAAKIIEEKRNKPGKILIVTYMNSAVNNFKNRISQVLQEKGILLSKDYDVMTIHSLALKILKDKPDLVGVNEEFKILDDIKKIFYLNECIDNWRRKGGERIFKLTLKDNLRNKYVNNQEKWWKDFFQIVDALISELKLNDISPEKLKIKLQELNNCNILKIILDIYYMYVKKLKIEGYIDYNDLLNLTYKALKNDDNLRKKFQNKYTFIFEDECQDSNVIQGKILTLLSKKWGNLVRVGDLNQSIMGTFTSSNPKFFKEFCEIADKTYTMNRASRSSKDIIDLANYLVDFVINNHKEKECREALQNQHIELVEGDMVVKNPIPDKYNIFAYNTSSWEKEIEKTIKAIENFRLLYPNKTIGILVPYNNQVNQIAQKLKRINIECDELSNTSEKRLRITNLLGNILEFLSEPDNIGKFKKLINSIIIKNNSEKEKVFNFIEKYNLENLFYSIEKENIPKDMFQSEVFKEFTKGIKIIKKIMKYPQTQKDKLILYIGDLLDLEIEDKAMIEAISYYVNYSVKDNPSLTLEDISKELFNNSNKIFRQISDVIYNIKGYEPIPDRVTISTYHKAKGLEWDCVFLLCLTKYNYPYLLTEKFRSDFWYLKEKFKNPIALGKAEISRIKKEDVFRNPIKESKIEIISEKIRLLYVGITRAKEFLILMAHESNKGKWNEDNPSIYFSKLLNYINGKREDVNGRC